VNKNENMFEKLLAFFMPGMYNMGKIRYKNIPRGDVG